MLEVQRSTTFTEWLTSLKDRQAVHRVRVRIARLEQGHFGDCKPVGSGVSELRIDCGPGYRLYFMRSGNTVVVLLIGGDKSTQQSDIKRAIEIASEWKE